jgi:hypothetical protein
MLLYLAVYITLDLTVLKISMDNSSLPHQNDRSASVAVALVLDWFFAESYLSALPDQEVQSGPLEAGVRA